MITRWIVSGIIQHGRKIKFNRKENMNSSRRIAIIIVTFLILGFFGVLVFNQQPNIGKQVQQQKISTDPLTASQPQIVDKQATFAIFINGTSRVFTAPKYHNLSPDVYIEAGNPNVIHIKKAGVTWNHFFSTLPFKLTNDCLTTGTNETFCTGSKGELKFYLHGERKEKVLDEEIQSGDKLLVTYGTESDSDIKIQIEKIP